MLPVSLASVMPHNPKHDSQYDKGDEHDYPAHANIMHSGS